MFIQTKNIITQCCLGVGVLLYVAVYYKLYTFSILQLEGQGLVLPPLFHVFRWPTLPTSLPSPSKSTLLLSTIWPKIRKGPFQYIVNVTQQYLCGPLYTSISLLHWLSKLVLKHFKCIITDLTLSCCPADYQGHKRNLQCDWHVIISYTYVQWLPDYNGLTFCFSHGSFVKTDGTCTGDCEP